MNIWAKMMSALRGDLDEASIDQQALQILDEQVRATAETIGQFKYSLADLLVRQQSAKSQCGVLREQIKTGEDYTLQALTQGQETLARDLAGQVAEVEGQLHQQQALQPHLDKSAADLRAAITQTESNLQRLKQQSDTIRATENVQRAQAVVANRRDTSGSTPTSGPTSGPTKIRTALDSLDAIKQKQALRAAQIEAASELADEQAVDSALEARLEKAGIAAADQRIDAILKRLKK